MSKDNLDENIKYVYVVSTDVGEFMYDQELNFLTGEDYEPVAMFSFQQETLATEADWKEWTLTFTEDMYIDQIRRLIRYKMKKIVSELEIH